MQCTLDAVGVRERFAHKPLGVLLLMAEKWLKDAAHITFHDPLAAALLFEPSLCGLETGDVGVELDGGTTFKPNPEGLKKVAKTVNSEAFFDHYFEILK